ncbi:MAG TPA: proline--tRNA ligase [Candidatus Omnitrophota bacterium]|nr:proline--tRNA ligase [Candidatus Omnitrophota bacterium]HPN66186.1 proline--tRNA ligase [Candidatus Omnitrophota bacterium]HRZ66515.1 proline--tRNA ligase [Candidatus Omnitrophota bacterium]
MRWSKSLIPTLKEDPADAEILSHKLMIRAGLIRKLATGSYSYLPLGMRVINKVEAIIREEMDKAGALEVMLPAVQPIELWQQTGRDADYGETMAKFKDRHGHTNVIAPTAEEVITSVAGGEIKSYKQLPINLYQISFKFRDEFRPRFGVLRSREFIMKDSYSFHPTPECLDKEYWNMYETYKRIFTRCGLDFVIVEAESGEMGGSGSHQFTAPCDSGEDVIVYTEDNSYAANLEKAAVDPLPKEQAVANAPKAEDVHTPNVGSIEAVCAFLKTKPKDMIKTLIFSVDKDIVVALVRGDHDLNPEKLTQTLGGKHNELAAPAVIEQVTGAKVGFAGPVGLAGKVSKVMIDHAVAAMAIGVTGANKTDHHTKNIVPGRDFPLTGANIVIADIRNAVEGDTHGGKKLLFRRGIEVGQVFKLGTKYSTKLKCNFLDESGREKPCIMGCYGIGVNRIVASLIEQSHDKDGIIWNKTIAPYKVCILPLNTAHQASMEAAEKIYNDLTADGIECILDDRPERAGVKFKDSDLIGFPIQIIIGEKNIANGNVEIKDRKTKEVKMAGISSVLHLIKENLI